MKILYVTLKHNNLNPGMEADYMSDLLYHGLYSLYGPDCVDYPAKNHLRPDYPYISNLWGRGFTYAKCLPNDETIDRSDIHKKILTGYYNLIVVSVHHTMHNNSAYVLEFLSSTQLCAKNKVVLVDGNDLTNYEPRYLTFIDKYFKREIPDDAPDYLTPIHFAIPESKIDTNAVQKTKDFAYIHPGSCDAHWPGDSRKTHIYTREEDYYDDYRTSYFAYTCKKGGWDCMRHYEIMANACIPIFTDIEWCPNRTLTNLPKSLLSNFKKYNSVIRATTSENKQTYGGHDIIQLASYINRSDNLMEILSQICHLIQLYALTHLTTRSLAKYFIGKIYD